MMGKRKLKRKIAALKYLVKHCWLHSGYENCGFRLMSSDQKRIYKKIVDKPAK